MAPDIHGQFSLVGTVILAHRRRRRQEKVSIGYIVSKFLASLGYILRPSCHKTYKEKWGREVLYKYLGSFCDIVTKCQKLGDMEVGGF